MSYHESFERKKIAHRAKASARNYDPFTKDFFCPDLNGFVCFEYWCNLFHCTQNSSFWNADELIGFNWSATEQKSKEHRTTCKI